MRESLFLLLGLLAPACQQLETPQTARAFVEQIPDQLLNEGPGAWGTLFEPGSSFFMASDGRVAFASPAEAQVFLTEFAPRVESLDLRWNALRVEPIDDHLAVVAAEYDETITLRDGSVSTFGGFMTGLARRRGGKWRLQHLHWSSPVPEAGAGE